MKDEESRLSRKLTTRDAIFIGLGSMIGAGIFVAPSPAAAAAQAGLVFGLIIAASVAFLNAMSSAQLARLYPSSGGTYLYAKERLSDFWAWVAGWGFIVGKFASCAAVALTFGYYLFPDYARFFAAGAVMLFMTLNYLGIKKTAFVTKVIVSAVMVSLFTIVLMTLSGQPDPQNLQPIYGESGLYGILQSAGIWFFAFAGYARIATLAEEVENPKKSIPKAIVISLTITLMFYAAVTLSALSVVGPTALSQSNAPLVTAVSEAGFSRWQWVVILGATLATLGVLISLMAGISRTLFAMAADKKLPSYLAKVHPTHKVPYLAEITVGLILIVVVLTADIRSAIGFSSFTVLLYYAVTNMAAYTLNKSERMFNRNLAVLGFIGCVVLSFTLPLSSVIAGSFVMAIGLVIYFIQKWYSAKQGALLET